MCFGPYGVLYGWTLPLFCPPPFGLTHLPGNTLSRDGQFGALGLCANEAYLLSLCLYYVGI